MSLPADGTRRRALRLGILGTARSAPIILVKPITRNADLAARVELVAIASRDATNAAAFASEWHIPKSFGSYSELLADPGIDAVYNSLPNAMHCEWTVRALLAGKHVLCGKPLCSNAREAVVMQRAAEDAGKVCLEAFHAICHPVCQRVRELIADGVVGKVEHVNVRYLVELSQYDARVRSKLHQPTPLAKDYRMRGEMAGGVTMDLGCYCVAMIKAITGEEPRVVRAEAKRWDQDPEIDVAMRCDLALTSGATADFECSFVAGVYNKPVELEITGNGGRMCVKGFFSAHKANEIKLEQWDDVGVRSREIVDDPAADNTRDSFYYQLMSFVDEVAAQEGKLSVGMPWDYTASRVNKPVDSVGNMAVIDAIYRAAGMKPRRTTYPPPPPYGHIGASKL